MPPDSQGALSNVVKIAKDVTELLNVVKKIEETLDTPRSVSMVVLNYTNSTLRIRHTRHEHGGFGEPPSHHIPAKHANVLSSQDKGFMTGTEGSISYAIDGSSDSYNIFWNNPFMGGNTQSSSVITPMPKPPGYPSWMPFFKVSNTYSAAGYIGVGNKCRARFEIWETANPPNEFIKI